MRRLLAAVAAACPLVPALLASGPHALAASCPPAGTYWSSGNATTGELDGSYLVNANWYNDQSGQHVIYLQNVGGEVGLCDIFQPSGHGDTGYPEIVRNFVNQGTIGSYATISQSYTVTTGPNWDGQAMGDWWLGGGTSDPSATEVEMVACRHDSAGPSGTQVGTTTIGGKSYAVWKNTGNNGHTYYAFIPGSCSLSGTLNVLAAFNWLVSHQGLSSSLGVVQGDFGIEFKDVSNGSGGTTSAFSIPSYSLSTS